MDSFSIGAREIRAKHSYLLYLDIAFSWRTKPKKFEKGTKRSSGEKKAPVYFHGRAYARVLFDALRIEIDIDERICDMVYFIDGLIRLMMILDFGGGLWCIGIFFFGFIFVFSDI